MRGHGRGGGRRRARVVRTGANAGRERRAVMAVVAKVGLKVTLSQRVCRIDRCYVCLVMHPTLRPVAGQAMKFAER